MATIIKPASSPESLPPVSSSAAASVHPVAFNLDEFQGQADRYLDTVRSEAARIIGQAHQEAEQIRQQAEEAGKTAAEQAIGRILDEKVAAQMQTLLPAMRDVADKLEDAKRDWLRHWQRQAVHLATAIAERIIRRELRQQPELSLAWIEEALELASGSADVTVRLSPQDHESLGTHGALLEEKLSHIANLQFVADSGISDGGCRVTTQFGSIDNRLETQLARIEEELTR